jgi:phage gp36-like protein
MGNYITRTDVEARLRRSFETLYTLPGESAVDVTLVDADIEAAEGTVDGYLAKRYLVPITDAQALRLCKAWALVLCEELAYGAVPGRELPESVSTRAAAARQQLGDAADGKMLLGAATTVAEASDASGCIVVAGDEPVMTRATMQGF